jgi:hypothetical protein
VTTWRDHFATSEAICAKCRTREMVREVLVTEECLHENGHEVFDSYVEHEPKQCRCGGRWMIWESEQEK